MQKPNLSFWQIWNVSFGFLGVQMGFALQNANVSRVLSDLGADLHSLSLFWLAAPIMGLLVQPLVGAASDKTWNRFGRRRPFILGGAIAAALGMLLMPNAPIVVSFIAPMIFGGLMLALMDGAFNVSMQPFRSLVSDMLPNQQRTFGYAIQALLINIGAVLGSMLPFLLTNVIGLDNTAEKGQVADSVIWAFYIGASILLGSVLWTVIRTKEYAPDTYNQYHQIVAEKKSLEKVSITHRLKNFFQLIRSMPSTIRQLAVVQFFSWFALFIMWVYTTPAITQRIWGLETKWFDSDYLHSLEKIPQEILAAKGAAGDWVGILFAAYSLFAALFAIVLTQLANRFGRKFVYSMSLLIGGLSYLSFFCFNNSELIQVNLWFTQITLPLGALHLLFPMIGIGIAWAAILALPYAILASSLPADKTGVYMGIFNFTIAAPQIVSGLLAGQLLKYMFDNNAVYIVMLAGVCMILGAIAVVFVRDSDSLTPS